MGAARGREHTAHVSSYEPEQRRLIAEALRAGTEPACPACGGRLATSQVTPPAQVSYVRQRVIVVCSECGRSAALDVPRGGVP